MSVCIYCRRALPPEAFNQEHVLPDAFGWNGGGFPTNAPTLLDAVCRECNQAFGDGIDNHLARDTVEGLYRYRFGVKSAEGFKPRGKRSTMSSWIRSGRWAGAVVWYRVKEDVLHPGFAPQVGFGLTRQGPFEFWFPVDALPTRERERELLAAGYQYAEFQGIEGADPEDNAEAIKVLAQRMGLEISGEPEVTLETGLTEWKEVIEDRWRTTEEFWRAVAKITLNYFAFVYGAEAAMHPRFDAMRNHIRYGAPLLPVWAVNGFPHPTRRRGQSYQVAVGQYGGGLAIQGRLQLLTEAVYTIALATDVPLFYLRPRGHRYDLDTGLVTELSAGALP